MAQRINVSVSDELFEWITEESEKAGIPRATYATMLLNQAKYTKEAAIVSQGILSFMDKLPDAERTMFLLGQKGVSDMVDDSAFRGIPTEQRDFILNQLEQRKKEGKKD